MNSGTLFAAAAFVALAVFPFRGTAEDGMWSALDLKLVDDGNAGDGGVYAQIKNHSDDYLCMDASEFAKYNTTLEFHDRAGKHVILQRSVEKDEESGSNDFRWNKPYLFVRPRESRNILLNLTNYALKDGVYAYAFTTTFFRCSDVIDPAKQPAAFGSTFRGNIVIRQARRD